MITLNLENEECQTLIDAIWQFLIITGDHIPEHKLYKAYIEMGKQADKQFAEQD